MSKHTLEYGMRARQFDPSDFQDQSVARILKKLSVIERAALPENELKEVSCKGTEQDGVSLATTLCGDTGFSQTLGNATGQPPPALERGDSLVPSTQSQGPCLQGFPPKGCLSQAAVGPGCLAHCLFAPVPPVLTPLCLHLGASEGTRGKHLRTSQWAVTFSKSRSKDNQLT